MITKISQFKKGNTGIKPFIFLLFLLVIIGCDRNETHDNMAFETDPAKIIIGKWEHYKEVNGTKTVNGQITDIFIPVENPDWYEFFEDSTIKREVTVENRLLTFTGKYWIDSLLYYNRELGLSPWKYEFVNDNKELILEKAFEAFTGIKSIYKRIK